MTNEKVLECLNEAFKNDPDAVHALICNRVPCNQKLADHPTVQVGQNPCIENGTWTVGMLGFINGILGAIEIPLVAAKWEDGRLIGFSDYESQMRRED